ncbi:phosphonate transport system permease protein [Gracilibacillus orientalis]|uniref:Phosphonate transport system permease protein n=1 Tax=Gracilibacillus orientalis TaxID=334253 RepID=A0A1I4JXJ5_9BACI|nr:phosphonate ABC transporter, permease protein PhnE [Gracilibacillus orientalis]SFL71061.1 phosphonate transport system permease protein [Gracilibacillus orientalis]
MGEIKDIRKTKRLQTIVILVFVCGLTVWSAIGTDFSFYEVFSGIGLISNFVFLDLLPPDVSASNSLLDAILETLYMGFVGMVIGAGIALVLSFLAASTTTPHPVIQVVVRAFTSIIRNIPGLIWALILVASYGIGVTVGTLSLILGSIGFLTRVFADTLEEIDTGKIEALHATGSNYFQILAQGVFPQFLPGFVAWSLYNLELNIRASTIIGMVGGGGIGFAIQKGIKLFQYKEVSMAIILVLILILSTEFLTSKIRERII